MKGSTSTILLNADLKGSTLKKLREVVRATQDGQIGFAIFDKNGRIIATADLMDIGAMAMLNASIGDEVTIVTRGKQQKQLLLSAVRILTA